PLDVGGHRALGVDDGGDVNRLVLRQLHLQHPTDVYAAVVNGRAFRHPVGAVGDDGDVGPLGEEEVGGAVGELEDHPREHPDAREDDQADHQVALVGGHGASVVRVNGDLILPAAL